MTPLITGAVVIGLGVFALGFIAVISRLLGAAERDEEESAIDLNRYRTFVARTGEPIPLDDETDTEDIDSRIRELLGR